MSWVILNSFITRNSNTRLTRKQRAVLIGMQHHAMCDETLVRVYWMWIETLKRSWWWHKKSAETRQTRELKYNEVHKVGIYQLVQGGSNMTGTNCDLFTHKSSRSYLNHLVYSNSARCMPLQNTDSSSSDSYNSQNWLQSTLLRFVYEIF